MYLGEITADTKSNYVRSTLTIELTPLPMNVKIVNCMLTIAIMGAYQYLGITPEIYRPRLSVLSPGTKREVHVFLIYLC